MNDSQFPDSPASDQRPTPPGEGTADCAQIVAVLREAMVSGDLIEQLCGQLRLLHDRVPSWDRATANLARFFRSARSPSSWLTLFERDPSSLPPLLTLLAASPLLADQLVADPEAFELLRLTEGKPVSPALLHDELQSELSGVETLRRAQRVLRLFRHREFLRIAYGQMTGHQSWQTAAVERTRLAEAILGAAVRWALRDTGRHLPPPLHADGRPIAVSVLGLGRLGGGDMDFSEDIDLILVRENAEGTAHWNSPVDRANTELFFRRFAQTFLRLVDEPTGDGVAYRVRLGPGPSRPPGQTVAEFRDAVVHFDSWGRTWERQAMIKARPVAGDLSLGEAFIRELEPWIYRRYLLPPDRIGLVALKRRIRRSEAAAPVDGAPPIRVPVERAVRRIEQCIEYMQLLHGGDLVEVRTANTTEAIDRLADTNCLTEDDRRRLREQFGFLRAVLEAVQTLEGPGTGDLPADADTLRCIASTIHPGSPHDSPPDRRLANEVQRVATGCDRFIDELLDRTSIAPELEAALATPESDLVLDPEPGAAEIASILQPYGFRDPQAAYCRLQDLAVESIPFLSSRRSRYSLALIAPALLQMVAGTPNPDATLIQLVNMSDSLGGKATLWELFGESSAAMQLGVRMSAASPYLVDILTSHPGMIDELLDSLMLARLPSRDEMASTVAELCRQTDDIRPVLASFKNSLHLRIGVRDILGQNTIEATHAALADVAEICLDNLTTHAYARLVGRWGLPSPSQRSQDSEPTGLCLVAVGKLGGREPNYHSGLDVLFVYDGEGETRSLVPAAHFQPTSNRHFFNQLAQDVIRSGSRGGGAGRLYDISPSLRPLGTGGPLAVTMSELQAHFSTGRASVRDILTLCNARPVWGDPVVRARVSALLQDLLASLGWTSELAQSVWRSRMDLQSTATEHNLKRGPGGTLDIEFAVRALQLEAAPQRDRPAAPGTLAGLEQLASTGRLAPADAQILRDNYVFLRSLESGIRLMNWTARHDLPEDPEALERLSYLLGLEGRFAVTASDLPAKVAEVRSENRRLFHQIFSRWLSTPRTAE